MASDFPVLSSSKTFIPLTALSKAQYLAWLKKQNIFTRQWLESNRFSCDAGAYCMVPGKNGSAEMVICGIDDAINVWSIAHLPAALPENTYQLEGVFSKDQATQLALGWALGCYQFTRYKTSTKEWPTLIVPNGCDLHYVRSMTEAIFWARDLINTPANDMNPHTLADEAVNWAKTYKAKIRRISGEGLIEANYPLIYAVGKAAATAPHLIDIIFPRKGAPKVTLVGKGVCFDSGGLDIKSAAGMKLMKKDMGGAACVLALARTIIDAKLNVELRVLLPIVENAVSGNAMRPLDIIRSRNGISVEIGNTDAEGRLIFCDALSDADDGLPDLLIDCATLTGAARVALGTEIPAFFTNDDALATELMQFSQLEYDPLWRLPLWKPYRNQLNCASADISNDPDNAYGGAITAALYLQEFVVKTASWLHIDMMAWNLKAQAGRPVGGEAMAVRALFALLKARYEK